MNVPGLPTNLTRSCNAQGTSMTLNWNLPAGYTTTYFRAALGVDNWTLDPAFQDDSAGTSKTITVTPEQTYHVWLNTKATPSGAWSDPIHNNFSCSPTSTYTVTPSIVGSGTISPNTPQTVNSGATKAFTVTPNVGYNFSMSGTCPLGSPTSGSSAVTYTTGAIVANCTVVATFSLAPPITYTVTPSIVGSGTISPNTPQTVNSGATKAFTVTPNVGYNFSMSGTCPLGSPTSGSSAVTYTTGAIVANCTVVATFSLAPPITYTVTPSIVGSGTISPNTPQTVNSGATKAFTVTPNVGYNFSMSGTCPLGSPTSGSSAVTYTTGAIVANCTVVATFSLAPPITYTVTPSIVGSGTISPNTPQTVNSGATKAFTVTPNVGYNFSMSGTCPLGSPTSGSSAVTYTTGAITADCTVVATFSLATATIDIYFDPPSIFQGKFAILHWSSPPGATSCTGTPENFTGGDNAISGEFQVSPLSTITYTVTCSDGGNGNWSAELTLIV